MLVHTGLAAGTVGVLPALRPRLDGVAATERIPGEAGATVAGGTVVPDLTHCIAGTRVGSNAGVDTSSVLTDLSVATLRVGGAARRRWWREIAGDVSISHVAWSAHADHCSLRQSVLHSTVGVLATG